MNNIFTQNFSKLKKIDETFCVHVLKAGSSIKPHKLTLIQGKDVTLDVDGMQLTSRHDRLEAAKTLCKDLNFKKDVHLYGLGLGDEARFILKHLNSNCMLHIHILNPRLFLDILGVDDEILNIITPFVQLIFDENTHILESNRICIVSELLLEPTSSNALKSRLINAINAPYAQARFNKTAGLRINKILQKNTEILKKESPLLISQFSKVKKALVLASGPSLAKDLSKILELKTQGYCLIAVETALHFLEAHKVIPDFIISIDDKVGKYAGVNFLVAKELYKKSTLIYAPWSDPNLFLNFIGKRYYLKEKRAQEVIPYLMAKADALWHSGSVMHAAVSLAQNLGASTIVLCGVDLCFDNDYSHAGIKRNADPYIAKADDITVLCNDGKRRFTQRNFNVYREDLEDYIAQHTEINFLTLDLGAAVIRGCRIFK